MAPTFLAGGSTATDHWTASEKGEPAGASAGPPNFGLPEHSALTIEGRIERAAGVAGRAVGVRQGRVRPLRRSNWAGGLLLIAGALALLIVVTLVLSLIR